MRKILYLVILIMFAIPNALADSGKTFSLNPKINSIKGFNAEASDVREVKKTLQNLDKYTNKKDLEGIKRTYSKDFYGSDGFNYDTYIKMVEETFSAYSEIKYKTKIKNISITGDWAIVQMTDKTTANLINNDFDDPKGELVGYCDYTIYLKKYDDGWKIISDSVAYEETSLKYGEAKKHKMNFEVPLFVKKGESYDLRLDLEPPKDVFVLASLAKEEVIYPPHKPKDAYRKLPNEGILERVVTANTKGYNEYASASIGFTKLTVEDTDIMQIKFKMSGMAFIMKRINVLENPPKPAPDSKKAAYNETQRF